MGIVDRMVHAHVNQTAEEYRIKIYTKTLSMLTEELAAYRQKGVSVSENGSNEIKIRIPYSIDVTEDGFWGQKVRKHHTEWNIKIRIEVEDYGQYDPNRIGDYHHRFNRVVGNNDSNFSSEAELLRDIGSFIVRLH